MKCMLMVILLLTVSCGDESSRQVSPVVITNSAADGSKASNPASPPQANRIRDVDFNNFTYHWYPKWEYMLSKRTEFTLQNGKLELDVSNGSNEPAAFELANIQYGDVTADSIEEAIITIKIDVMGNSMPYALFVYSLIDGAPRMLWVHETGDRADGGLRNVYVTTDHLLAVDQYNPDQLNSSDGESIAFGLCCPKTLTHTLYKWHDSEFKKVRQETHRNNYNDARILIGSKNGER